MDSAAVVRAEGVREDEIRIVMIGKTGVGKSATGNTILNRPGHFESSLSGESITKMCRRGEAFRFGKKLLVVDTPGLFDTGLSNEDVSKEIVKCIGITSPGPHAFVLVVRLGRFTKEEQDTVKHFANIFGPGMYNYLIVLFTRKDELNKDLDDYVARVKGELKEIIQKCGQRCVAFNNIAPEEQDTKMLIEMVQTMVKGNGGSYYTHGAYAEAEQSLIKRMKLFLVTEQKKMDEDIKEIRMSVSTNYEYIIEQETAKGSNVKEIAKLLEGKIKQNEKGFDEEKQKAWNEKGNRKVGEIVKQFQENQHWQIEKPDEQRGKETQMNDVINGITRQRTQRVARQIEDILEHQREDQFRKDTEAARLRDRARDECENESKGILAWFVNGIKKFIIR